MCKERSQVRKARSGMLDMSFSLSWRTVSFRAKQTSGNQALAGAYKWEKNRSDFS